MFNQNFDHLSVKHLNQRKRLSNFALAVVSIGALLAITASFYVFSVDGVMPITTLVVSILALIAAFPVYLEKKQVLASLKRKGY